jgi:hypothetical protein
MATMTWSDAGIESPRHHVDRQLARRELKVNFRIGGQETPPDRHHDHRRRHVRGKAGRCSARGYC